MCIVQASKNKVALSVWIMKLPQVWSYADSVVGPPFLILSSRAARDSKIAFAALVDQFNRMILQYLSPHDAMQMN